VLTRPTWSALQLHAAPPCNPDCRTRIRAPQTVSRSWRKLATFAGGRLPTHLCIGVVRRQLFWPSWGDLDDASFLFLRANARTPTDAQQHPQCTLDRDQPPAERRGPQQTPDAAATAVPSQTPPSLQGLRKVFTGSVSTGFSAQVAVKS
jgi:hypothetical protein